MDQQNITTVKEWLAFAKKAEQRGDVAEALARYTDLYTKFPTLDAGYVRAVALCLKMDNIVPAEQICLQGLAAMPYSPSLWKHYAEIATRQEQLHDAEMRMNFATFLETDRTYERAAEQEHFSEIIQPWIKTQSQICASSMDTDRTEAFLHICTELQPENQDSFCAYVLLPLRNQSHAWKNALQQCLDRAMELHGRQIAHSLTHSLTLCRHTL